MYICKNDCLRYDKRLRQITQVLDLTELLRNIKKWGKRQKQNVHVESGKEVRRASISVRKRDR